MPSTKFKVGDLWRSRDGGVWRILATDRPGHAHPVVAMTIKEGTVSCFSEDGQCLYTLNGVPTWDLIAPHREPREFWVRPADNAILDSLPAGPRGGAGWIRVREVLNEEAP